MQYTETKVIKTKVTRCVFLVIYGEHKAYRNSVTNRLDLAFRTTLKSLPTQL